MFNHLVVSSALFASSLATGLVPTPSTSDATITPGPQIELLRKQNNDRYIGWVSWNGEWASESCNLGGTYYQTGEHWRCCATTADGCAQTDIPIGCISGSLIYPVTGSSLSSSLVTWPCTSIFTDPEDQSFTICNTVFMYENERDSSPLTNVNCGVSSVNWSYYRVAPAAATEITSSIRSPSPTSRSNSAISTPTTTPTPSPIPPIPDEKEESKAWIAGAVVGPVVGLALIGFLAFFFIRRKKNKQAQAPAGATSGGAPPAASGGFPQQNYPTGPNSPPQYYPPPMQQSGAAPGVVPFGVSKHDSWVPPHSPVTQGSTSPNAQTPYGAPPQWQGQNNLQINQAPPPGGQPVYGGPSPSMSPQPGHVQPNQYGGDDGMYKHTAETARPFSSELEGSYAHGQPEYVNMQPKTN